MPEHWTMYFDGAFSCRNGGAGIVLTSPKGDKLHYAVQLCFAMDKISNNIAEFEGLLAGLRTAIALGIQRLLIKGDSQLLVNFSNKSYTPKTATWPPTLRRSASSRSISRAWSSCTFQEKKTTKLMISLRVLQEDSLKRPAYLKKGSPRHP